MMRLRVLLVMLTSVFAGQLKALPTMIRLGYVNCAACHVAPQGGGLLNAYGRSIDEAQSLRGGEYAPTTNAIIRALELERAHYGRPALRRPGAVEQFHKLSMARAVSRSVHVSQCDGIRPRLPFLRDGGGRKRERRAPVAGVRTGGPADASLCDECAAFVAGAQQSGVFRGARRVAERCEPTGSRDLRAVAQSAGILRCAHAGEGVLVGQAISRESLFLRTGRERAFRLSRDAAAARWRNSMCLGVAERWWA